MRTPSIDVNAVYFVRDLVRLFGFTASSLRTARRNSGLRTGKRLGRTYTLGSWLLAWFEAGEQTKPASRPSSNGVDSSPSPEPRRAVR